MKILRCKNCKTEDIRLLAWIEPNTNKFIKLFEGKDNSLCEKCGYTEYEEFEKEVVRCPFCGGTDYRKIVENNYKCMKCHRNFKHA
jgi:DNA-directed RNA polymerase subunit RPC12/RpoP